MATGCPMMKMKRQTDHPCFGGDHSKAGRLHLPVAPGCNIKCGFCERKFDCANESRPGVTSKVLTPEQAVDALIYWPHPETKSEHLQAPDVLEVLAPHIQGLAYGDRVTIELAEGMVVLV